MPQLPAGRRASSSGAPATTSSPSVSTSSPASSRVGLGLGIQRGRRSADRVDAAHAVQHLQQLGEVEARALREAPPVSLDDGARVDERAVEVEQERRHTRIRAASRTVPKTASSTSPRSSPSACSGIGLLAGHAHLVDVVQVGQALVGAIGLAAGHEQLRGVARQVPPVEVARHHDVEPALERRARRQLERERPHVAPGMDVGDEDAAAVGDHAAVHADLELRVAEVAAQQRAHDLRREVGVAGPLAPRPPRLVDEAHGLGVRADPGGEREAPAVDDAEVDAPLAALDERGAHAPRGRADVARHAQRARQHARPAGGQHADRDPVPRPVQHLVGRAVAAQRADGVEAERDRLLGQLDAVLVALACRPARRRSTARAPARRAASTARARRRRRD